MLSAAAVLAALAFRVWRAFGAVRPPAERGGGAPLGFGPFRDIVPTETGIAPSAWGRYRDNPGVDLDACLGRARQLTLRTYTERQMQAFMRQRPRAPRSATALSTPAHVRFHLYWEHRPAPTAALQHNVNRKLLVLLMSYFATQQHARISLTVWTATKDALMQHPVLRPFIERQYLLVREFDPLRESVGTPVEGNTRILTADDRRVYLKGDLFRLLIMHNYGGVYVDADSVFLNDYSPLLFSDTRGCGGEEGTAPSWRRCDSDGTEEEEEEEQAAYNARVTNALALPTDEQRVRRRNESGSGVPPLLGPSDDPFEPIRYPPREWATWWSCSRMRLVMASFMRLQARSALAIELLRHLNNTKSISNQYAFGRDTWTHVHRKTDAGRRHWTLLPSCYFHPEHCTRDLFIPGRTFADLFNPPGAAPASERNTNLYLECMSYHWHGVGKRGYTRPIGPGSRFERMERLTQERYAVRFGEDELDDVLRTAGVRRLARARAPPPPPPSS